MSSEYEIQRQKNIDANRLILASLGLERPALHEVVSSASGTNARKRKFTDEAKAIERRKSRRLSSKTLKRERDDDAYTPSEASDDGVDENYPTINNEDLMYEDDKDERFKRRTVSGRYVASYDPKLKMADVKPIYGAVTGVKVGTWWPERRLAALANIHRPWVAGIHGNKDNGCYSIALSGGYEDDIDEGFRFTFTGSGGRELKKKNLRTAPQSRDQPLNDNNLSLIRSCELKKPVRVIRGFKGYNKWSPESGYRYDGLYQVMKWWQDTGISKYKVYRFALKRMDGQEPLMIGKGKYIKAEDSGALLSNEFDDGLLEREGNSVEGEVLMDMSSLIGKDSNLSSRVKDDTMKEDRSTTHRRSCRR